MLVTQGALGCGYDCGPGTVARGEQCLPESLAGRDGGRPADARPTPPPDGPMMATPPANLRGSVRDVGDDPVVGAQVSIGLSRTTTDGDGRFSLQGAPSGSVQLVVDGRDLADASGRNYTRVARTITLPAGDERTLDRPVVLPSVNARIELTADLGPDGKLARDVLLPLPGLPGGQARFARGTRFGDPAARAPSPVVLAVHETPSDRVSWPLPSGIGPAALFGLEPAGLLVDPPAEVILPAPAGFSAGSRVRLWQMDPDTGVYAPLPGSSAGNATVIARDGVRTVVPDEGARLARLGTLLVVPPDAIMVRGCAAEMTSGSPIVQGDVDVLDERGTAIEGSPVMTEAPNGCFTLGGLYAPTYTVLVQKTVQGGVLAVAAGPFRWSDGDRNLGVLGAASAEPSVRFDLVVTLESTLGLRAPYRTVEVTPCVAGTCRGRTNARGQALVHVLARPGIKLRVAAAGCSAPTVIDSPRHSMTMPVEVAVPDLREATPAVTEIWPAARSAGRGEFTISVSGQGLFMQGAQMTLGGITLQTTLVSVEACDRQTMLAIVPGVATQAPGPRELVVDNGMGRTARAPFLVVSGPPQIDGFSPRTGRPGDAVAITGRGLGLPDRTAFVTFNGARAELTSWSDGLIVVRVPADAVDGPIGVQLYDTQATSAALGEAGIFRVERPDGGVRDGAPDAARDGAATRDATPRG